MYSLSSVEVDSLATSCLSMLLALANKDYFEVTLAITGTLSQLFEVFGGQITTTDHTCLGLLPTVEA